MGHLRVAVLGPPEIFHGDRRLTFALSKAQALLLYLAVEGGLHSRAKLAALLWPDAAPDAARKQLRSALLLLRRVLSDADGDAAHPSHVLSQRESLGLNPDASMELDLDIIGQAYEQFLKLPSAPLEPQRDVLIEQGQRALALARAPFLDGFWLRDETGFDMWHTQQQRHWHVRVLQLLERLSSWQEAAGQLEPARVTLARWLAFDPLAEEAYRRSMRAHLARGDPTAALRDYATLRERLAEELQAQPSAETAALAEYVRATASRTSRPTHPSASLAVGQPTTLAAPLVGRGGAFTQLLTCFEQARQRKPQAVLLEGEAGIGKSRLAQEFGDWARAQGADVLRGQAFEMGGRLPYHPLVEALRQRLEEENAPEDLLDDPWLAELSRLLPELRVRYPDLPEPAEDELTAKLQLFEAVARLMDALSQRAPVVLLLDDLHWADGASLDLVRYLGRYWSRHGVRALLLGATRSKDAEFNPHLSVDFSNLERDLPVTRIQLHTLSRQETTELLHAVAGDATPGAGAEAPHRGEVAANAQVELSHEVEAPLVALGDALFASTGGQPLYLLETLKLFRERHWLVARLRMDGNWSLEPTDEMVAALAQPRLAWLPSSVRALILARVARLRPPARQLVTAASVLGSTATANLLWRLADLDAQAGVEGLEQAVDSGILREEDTGVSRQANYRFTHDMIRDVVYTELGAARRYVLHQRALALLQVDGARAAELAYHALGAGEVTPAVRYSMQAGDEALAVFAVEDAIDHFEQARALLDESEVARVALQAAEVANLYVSLGQAHAYLNDWKQAQDAFEALVAYARRNHLSALLCAALNRLAILALQQSNDKSQARAILEEAKRIAEMSHEQQALAATECNLAQIIGVVWEDPPTALPHGAHALAIARATDDRDLQATCLFVLGWVHIRAGDFNKAVRYLEAALPLYTAVDSERSGSRELYITHVLSGTPLTRPLAWRTAQALCQAQLSVARLHCGLVDDSVASGRIALALAREIKNGWVQVISTNNLTHALLDAGDYEEALTLVQRTEALARSLPPAANFLVFLTALGSAYQAAQQWDAARSALEEAVFVAEKLHVGPLCVPALSRLCLCSIAVDDWDAAYHYAMRAHTMRENTRVALVVWDFQRPFETEALLRGGSESLARAAIQYLGERLGRHRRFRLPFLRSLAALALWREDVEQATGYLREAAVLASDLGLPGERWQVLATCGQAYAAEQESERSGTAYGEAVAIIKSLTARMEDATMSARFLSGPQVHAVLQRAQLDGLNWEELRPPNTRLRRGTVDEPSGRVDG